MQLELHDGENGITILTLGGELDNVDLPALRSELDRTIAAGTRKLVIESPGLEFIGSAALGYLVSTAKQLQAEHGACVLAEPSRFFRRTLDHLGLDGILPVFDSRDAAIEHLGVD